MIEERIIQTETEKVKQIETERVIQPNGVVQTIQKDQLIDTNQTKSHLLQINQTVIEEIKLVNTVMVALKVVEKAVGKVVEKVVEKVVGKVEAERRERNMLEVTEEGKVVRVTKEKKEKIVIGMNYLYYISISSQWHPANK